MKQSGEAFAFFLRGESLCVVGGGGGEIKTLSPPVVVVVFIFSS